MATSILELPILFKQGFEATQVKYAKLGSSGLRVSLPILGGMSFGHKDWREWVEDDEEEVGKLLKGAYDRGLNTWDTANVYSGGVSEEMIGRAIKKYEIPRHKIIIMTKCYFPSGEQPAVNYLKYPELFPRHKDYVNQYGLSRAAIFNAVTASLKRLQTDYIDLLQIHRYDPSVPPEETMKALHDLVETGKVRYIGASSMWAYQFAKLQYTAEKNGWTKFISMQNHYSLLYREEEREMIKLCHETGVGLVPWGPLYSGVLARPWSEQGKTTRANEQGKVLNDTDKEIVNRVEELANKKGWKMGQVALAWVVQKGTIPIVGFSNLERLDEAVAVKDKTLTEEEIKYLEEPYQPKAVQGHS
ncbi:aldo-keto reductase [Talaromyces proteolyticus]|uniref:Aldo-keto reductase n=1 Tax=Talaromyces proteolyticus TaxID=1131652 RepID=A0AAD4L3K7_9EURO|nr:aldo-keto reductase [Talaromyces proteolyticus]KAH8705278.1 aldo-keto reductase [Talaromyces proteolyticus]